MSIVILFNKQRLKDNGLIVNMDTSENGYAFFDLVENARLIPALGRIKYNEQSIEGLFTLETDRKRATLTTKDLPQLLLDLENVHIEISIFGEITNE